MLSSLPMPFSSTRPEPARPETEPPTENVPVAHVTATSATSAEPTVPEAFATVQLCAGPLGCALTVTLYVAPDATGFGNVKAPSALIGRSSAPLFCRTRPVPA